MPDSVWVSPDGRRYLVSEPDNGAVWIRPVDGWNRERDGYNRVRVRSLAGWRRSS